MNENNQAIACDLMNETAWPIYEWEKSRNHGLNSQADEYEWLTGGGLSQQ